MKAIYVRFTDIAQNLVPFNNELKDCKQIIEKLEVADGFLFIIDNYSRKDKLEKINNE